MAFVVVDSSPVGLVHHSAVARTKAPLFGPSQQWGVPTSLLWGRMLTQPARDGQLAVAAPRRCYTAVLYTACMCIRVASKPVKDEVASAVCLSRPPPAHTHGGISTFRVLLYLLCRLDYLPHYVYTAFVCSRMQPMPVPFRVESTASRRASFWHRDMHSTSFSLESRFPSQAMDYVLHRDFRSESLSSYIAPSTLKTLSCMATSPGPPTIT